MNPTLSIIVICGNEEDVIVDCLKSCLFADEIILVTTYTTTKKTISLAKNVSQKIKFINAPKAIVDFSYWRNTGATVVTSSWILYVDADERINPDLREKIKASIKSKKFTNFDIPRANFFLGHRVKYGNSYPDFVKRLFLKSKFDGYVGALHEQPTIQGPSEKLSTPFLHFTHRNLASMLEKSLSWTPIESQLLYDSQHPPVVWWRFPRMMLTKLWERLIIQQMWRDGTVGWISAIFETFDTFLIYARLWELQQQK